MHISKGCKKLATEISFTLHSPLFIHSSLLKFHSRWGEPFPGEEALILTTYRL